MDFIADALANEDVAGVLGDDAEFVLETQLVAVKKMGP